MKRILISTALIIVSLFTAFAQEHLTFQGIPITGSPSSFCKKLANKGLKEIGSENNVYILEGNFSDREAVVGVVSDPDTDNVNSVVVLFLPTDNWRTLFNTYIYFRDYYTGEYGNPVAFLEEDPIGAETDIDYFNGIMNGSASYKSTFSAPGGFIFVSIEKDEDSELPQVHICYQDALDFDNLVTD